LKKTTIRFEKNQHPVAPWIEKVLNNKQSDFPGQEAQEEEKQWHSLASTTLPAMDCSRKGHNTLEKGDMLSNRTIRSLAKLVLAAEVHILSYVGTNKMKKRTLNQMGPHSPASDGKDHHLQDLLAADWPGGKGGHCLWHACRPGPSLMIRPISSKKQREVDP
jgi:hypothetical protein